MKRLTKGIFYYKPADKKQYIAQGISEEKVAEYTNDNLTMIWHECEKWSKRPGVNRVSLKCLETTEDVSHYECAHCGFKYELDNYLELATSKG
jgi:hypothetical protein